MQLAPRFDSARSRSRSDTRRTALMQSLLQSRAAPRRMSALAPIPLPPRSPRLVRPESQSQPRSSLSLSPSKSYSKSQRSKPRSKRRRRRSSSRCSLRMPLRMKPMPTPSITPSTSNSSTATKSLNTRMRPSSTTPTKFVPNFQSLHLFE